MDLNFYSFQIGNQNRIASITSCVWNKKRASQVLRGSFWLVFSQGAGGSFAYDYTKKYTISGRLQPFQKQVWRYTLPQDSFVSSDDDFTINGGACSKFWTSTTSKSYGGGSNVSDSQSTEHYIRFALCKKGDIISTPSAKMRWSIDIVPVRR